MADRKDTKQAENLELPPGTAKGFLRDNLEVVLFAMVLVIFFKTFVGQQFTIPTGSMRNTLMIGDHLLVNKFIFARPQWRWEEVLFPMRGVQRGDIIVFRYPLDRDQDFVKRCVAKEGDELEVRNKRLYVNGKLVTGAWEHHRMTDAMTGTDAEHAIYKDAPLPGPWPEALDAGVIQPPAPTLWPYMDEHVLQASQQGQSETVSGFRDHLNKVKVPKGYVFAMGDNRDASSDSRYWGFLPMDHLRGRPFIVWWSFKEGGNDETSAKPADGPTSVAGNFIDGARHFWAWTRWDRTGTIPR